ETLPICRPCEEWALPVVPDRAFSIFVAPDLTFGLVGNPIEQTVCVFGQPLLDAVMSGSMAEFVVVLRCDGLPVNPPMIPFPTGQW
ncbi:MAG: hypothetical protein C0467_32415, partial [Planctomycetaceae bacterium]|nr:hypothetical protein [Planctomycetaceae bacterium]